MQVMSEQVRDAVARGPSTSSESVRRIPKASRARTPRLTRSATTAWMREAELLSRSTSDSILNVVSRTASALTGDVGNVVARGTAPGGAYSAHPVVVPAVVSSCPHDPHSSMIIDNHASFSNSRSSASPSAFWVGESRTQNRHRRVWSGSRSKESNVTPVTSVDTTYLSLQARCIFCRKMVSYGYRSASTHSTRIGDADGFGRVVGSASEIVCPASFFMKYRNFRVPANGTIVTVT